MNNNKVEVTKAQIEEALADFTRRKRLEGMTYDQKKLSEQQVEKLLTDNYNLDFLGSSSPGKKFRQVRYNIKNIDKD